MELINENGELVKEFEFNGIDLELLTNEWDIAHAFVENEYAKNGKTFYVEPNIESNIYDETKRNVNDLEISYKYLENWPEPPKQIDRFAWHLNEEYSQLKKAKNAVLEKVNNPIIKIAIIDTGYQLDHPALPENLDSGISFIKGEFEGPAIDVPRNNIGEQHGHGNATISLLAGGKVTKEITDGEFEGYFGAIPFAKIIPIRISETPALIRNKNFVSAINYAIDQGCEVISMSMGGAPTKAWANAINRAYEAGIVVVTAAGNNWTKGVLKLMPKRLLYPARWERVIAAAGVTSKHTPYVFDVVNDLEAEGGDHMQGNYGPKKAMKSALASYTPNISWATSNNINKSFSLDGGGTSSATPQIAAAAALYICYYKDKLNALISENPNQKWRKVEAVKNALFYSGNKEYHDYKTYFGNGILKAYDALSYEPKKFPINISKKAKVTLRGVAELLKLLLGLESKNELKKIQDELLTTELVYILHSNPKLFKLLNYDDDDEWTPEDKDLVKKEILSSNIPSMRLKDRLM